MRDDGGNPSQLPKLSLRAEATAYFAAFFSIGLQPMANVVVPLWAIHLGIPPLLFGIVVIPLTFLRCIYFPWAQLESIRWLQILVLVNPLVYMSEGFRAALTPVRHMSLWAIYPVLIGFTAIYTLLAIVEIGLMIRIAKIPPEPISPAPASRVPELIY